MKVEAEHESSSIADTGKICVDGPLLQVKGTQELAFFERQC